MASKVKAPKTIEDEAMVVADNSATAVAHNSQLELMRAEKRRKDLLAEYKSEPKRGVYLSPMYRAYFGNVMQVSINGITIAFPVDGSVQEVPETFADEIEGRRRAIDAILNKQNLMASVGENFERTPGELNLF